MPPRVFKALSILLLATCAISRRPKLLRNSQRLPIRATLTRPASAITFDLGPNWLFAPGDNPAWALPAFDDSGWKTISTDKPLTDYGYRDLPRVWYRLHIHLRPGTRNLSIGIMGVAGNYEVFANGVTHRRQRQDEGGAEFTAGLAALLCHSGQCWLPRGAILSWPFASQSTRERATAAAPAHRSIPTPSFSSVKSRRRIFESFVAAHSAGPAFLLCGLALLAGLIAFALYFALQSQQEYLAIAHLSACLQCRGGAYWSGSISAHTPFLSFLRSLLSSAWRPLRSSSSFAWCCICRERAGCWRWRLFPSSPSSSIRCTHWDSYRTRRHVRGILSSCPGHETRPAAAAAEGLAARQPGSAAAAAGNSYRQPGRLLELSPNLLSYARLNGLLRYCLSAFPWAAMA